MGQTSETSLEGGPRALSAPGKPKLALWRLRQKEFLANAGGGQRPLDAVPGAQGRNRHADEISVAAVDNLYAVEI